MPYYFYTSKWKKNTFLTLSIIIINGWCGRVADGTIYLNFYDTHIAKNEPEVWMDVWNILNLCHGSWFTANDLAQGCRQTNFEFINLFIWIHYWNLTCFKKCISHCVLVDSAYDFALFGHISIKYIETFNSPSWSVDFDLNNLKLLVNVYWWHLTFQLNSIHHS